MSVLAIHIPVTVIKEKVAETTKITEADETVRAGEDGKKNKGDRYSENFVRVLSIWYSMIFQKKFYAYVGALWLN